MSGEPLLGAPSTKHQACACPSGLGLWPKSASCLPSPRWLPSQTSELRFFKKRFLNKWQPETHSKLCFAKDNLGCVRFESCWWLRGGPEGLRFDGSGFCW